MRRGALQEEPLEEPLGERKGQRVRQGEKDAVVALFAKTIELAPEDTWKKGPGYGKYWRRTLSRPDGKPWPEQRTPQQLFYNPMMVPGMSGVGAPRLLSRPTRLNFRFS